VDYNYSLVVTITVDLLLQGTI